MSSHQHKFLQFNHSKVAISVFHYNDGLDFLANNFNFALL